MQDAFAHCEALVRAADKDRFLSTLFAPADRRPGLFALHAFNLEIARVREAVRDPVAGEIRLQWWSDALSGAARGDAEANPVAAALLATVERYGLSANCLRGLVDARRFDLYDEPMATLADLMRYADGVSSSLVSLAALILDAGHTSNALSTAAGRAYAIAGLLKAFPAHATRGQLYVPVEVLRRHGADRLSALSAPAPPPLRAALAEMRTTVRDLLTWGRGLIGGAPPQFLPALLPVGLVGPTLDRMDRPGYDPFVPVDIPQWRRQWLIWRAARRPARIFA
jgi:15-cis-phytoene synthase